MSLTIDDNQIDLHTSSKNTVGKPTVTPSWSINQHRRQNSPTTAYPPRISTGTGQSATQPVIPNPEVFRGLTSLLTGDFQNGSPASSSASLPTVAECAVHLELLLCISTLHYTVDQSRSLDRAFTIFPRPRTVQWRHRTKRLKDSTFDTRRKRKWPTYLNMAVKRFLVWISAIDAKLAALDQTRRMGFFPPPLDILMVWHAVLLNPSYYVKFCQAHDLMTVVQVGFPWKEIHEAINSENYAFTPPTPALEKFQEMTGLEPDLFESICHHSVSEPVAIKLAGLIESTIPRLEVYESKHVYEKDLLPGGKAFLGLLDKGNDANNLTVKDIADAVTRQLSFCQKMELQLWIRSPAALGTLTRARARYGRFLQLFKLYPHTMLVPTLDIDLVWHTHQLSHQRYTIATAVLAGDFIDHDDKLGKTTLNNGMERTESLYRIRFGAKYHICTCWDCEALVSALEKADLEDSDNNTETPADIESLVNQVSADVQYYRTAEKARRTWVAGPQR
ncbi:uncharacterized protein Z518_10811 [Rhinocladiella mackenziei CBS 650.93]|uniref:Uncharacterized protein n=1 Tax=Rhinocladiella mackenziei CBS 650.93 TaxID=1442369 RepID=A0A0D2I2A3_9EURO|nr:uncharacterized protein Z518_10811 [Rhinocladiella mackenziei CBS 650.93]KIW99883.1 hypothetical protein Z518_10811 [Rhinocladiella mackenziei CBS 650.93]